MRSTFFGLEIGRTGLHTSQYGLDVTGHNIANVDTLGYTRQRVISTAYDPYAVRGKIHTMQQALIGGGSFIRVHDQVRSAFLDRQFRTEQALYSYWDTRSQGLTYIQSAFEDSEASLSLNNIVDKLFQSFLVETTNTDDADPRDIIRENAETMMQQFKIIYQELTSLQKGYDDSYIEQVNQINTTAKSLAALNESIYLFEHLSGEYANDLRDKRNLLLDQLSEVADITYETSSDGKFTVKLAGEILVSHVTYNELAIRTETNELTGEADIGVAYWVNGSDPNAVPDPIYKDLDFTKLKGGTLKSTKDMRDSMEEEMPGIPYYVEKLNNLARAIVQEVNAQHRQGWTYPYSGSDSVQGVDFFFCATKEVAEVDGSGVPTGNMITVYDYASITANNLRLSDEVAADINNIASSTKQINLDPDTLTPEQLQGSNNVNMKAIAKIFELKDISVDGVTIGSIEGYITNIGTDLFSELYQCNQNLDAREIQLLDVDNQRKSVSGVSLDEEMTNMMKYTHAYNGAARVITAMDDALETLINRMGRVGL